MGIFDKLKPKPRPELDEERLIEIINKLTNLFEELAGEEELDILLMLNSNPSELAVFHSSSCPRCMNELLTKSLDFNNVRHAADEYLEKTTKH